MVYLIIANSYHLLEDEIRKIFSSMDDVEVIDYAKSSIKEIVELCGYISLFDDTKKIVVKNCNFFTNKGNTDLSLLEKYLENPNPNTTIIFTNSDKADERKKIFKLIKEKKGYIYVKQLNFKDISSKLVEIAKENKYKLSLRDADYITEAAINNVDIAILELNKVFLYYGKGCEIKRNDLENIISHNMDDNNFRFVDAVVKRDIELAMKYMRNFKLFKIEPMALVNLLTREYRIMLIAKDLYKKGFSNRAIGYNISVPDWKIDNSLKVAYNYSIKELEDKLMELVNLDFKMKTSQIDKYLGLEMFVLNA